jgi:hypothetical protein
MTNPCSHARSAAEFITGRAIMGRKKYGHTLADAALSPAALVRHAREEAADLLVYLTALEAALSWQPPETAPPNRSILVRIPSAEHYGPPRWHVTAVGMGRDVPDEGVTGWMSLPGDLAGVPRRAEPARPAVTRVVTEAKYTDCPANAGDCCAPDKCPCAQTIDAIMALIEGGGA